MDYYPIPEQTVPEKPPIRRRMLWLAVPMLAIAFVFVCSALLQVVLHALMLKIYPSVTTAAWYPWVLSMLPMYGIAMPLSLLIYKLAPADAPVKREMDPWHWLLVLGLCFSLTYLGNFLGTFVNYLIGVITGTPQTNEFADAVTGMPLWVTVLFVGILAPIMEEIFYRKLVIDRIARFGDLPAILISGILFGLIHGNFSQFFYAAAIGTVLGYIYVKTGNIRYTVLLHMCVNFVGGVYSNEMLKRLDLEALETGSFVGIIRSFSGLNMYYAYLFFMAFTTIFGIVAFFLLRRRIHFYRPSQSTSAKEWAILLLANPASYVLLAVIAFLFLV
ncbi:MAG: CPBP family intramembrane metalloprotease [Clostridia bacterium]|nr:CPBP family intramembrane metalloprotease [Clostridia bacterium]